MATNVPESTPGPHDGFDTTMRGLEAGLKVGDIATYGLETCDADDPADEVLEADELRPFDWIPVRKGGRIVGVLERGGSPSSRPASESMHQLDDALLVAAGEPLMSFIPLLVESPYRLVVRGARIEGIVTRSDVHKLPVRLLAFALITHLEMTMADLIERRSNGDAWIDLLNDARRRSVEDKRTNLRAKRLDPPLIEVTEFCDKRDILDKMGCLGAGSARTTAVKDLRRVEDLRNPVAHAASFAADPERFGEFIMLLEVMQRWIRDLGPTRSAVSPE